LTFSSLKLFMLRSRETCIFVRIPFKLIEDVFHAFN
jgi:hypothetical protein